MLLRNMLVRLHHYLQSNKTPLSNLAMIPAFAPIRVQHGPSQRKAR